MQLIKHFLISSIFFCGFSSCKSIILTTHIYIQNFTNIEFAISLEQADLSKKTAAFASRNIILIEPCKVILAMTLDRIGPIGERIYTLKLSHYLDVIHIRLKLSRTDQQKISNLSLNLEQDLWHDILHSTKHKPHYQKIGDHEIAIDYDVENNYLSQDITFSIFEISKEPKQSSPAQKTDKELSPVLLTLQQPQQNCKSCSSQINNRYVESTLTTLHFFNIISSTKAGLAYLQNMSYFQESTSDFCLRYLIVLADTFSRHFRKSPQSKYEQKKSYNIFIRQRSFTYPEIPSLQYPNYIPMRALEIF